MATSKQHVDQAAKGGALGVLVYLAAKYDLDPEVVALLMPVAAAVLSWASTKVGDPMMASFFATKPAETKKK